MASEFGQPASRLSDSKLLKDWGPVSMRNAVVLIALVFSACLFTTSQTAPAAQGEATPNSPTAQDAVRPQSQMPPDSKAPAPTAKAPEPGAVQSRSEPRYLKDGSEIRATLDTPLSTKTAKVGDRFTATVSAPVRDSSGYVIVPIGSKLNGQVSESTDERLAGAIKDMGHLNLRFTDVQLPDGTDIPLSATLISVHNTKPSSTAPGRGAQSQPSPGIGANAGLTGAFGPPLRGLAVGTLTGGGYVLATKGKQVELPAECGLRLRVDRNTPLP
jgi:hypothetical protein